MEIENKLRSMGKNIALQGALIVEGIQNNKLKLKGQTVFSAIDIDKFDYLNFSAFTGLLKQVDLPGVPILSEDYMLENDIDAFVKMATIKSQIFKAVWAEGIVIRLTHRKDRFAFLHREFQQWTCKFQSHKPSISFEIC